MKFSIITPSCNQGLYIKKCIESIINQQGIQKEQIILDNCSIDQTKDILGDYQSNLPQNELVINIEPDGGQTEAINKGFKMATGDVVCWLNTDEHYLPGVLAEVASFFDEHPQVDVVFGDCVFVDSAGNVIKNKKEYWFSKSMLLYYGCYIPSCSTFIRRRIIDDGHLLDESFRVTMDFEYLVRLATLGYRFKHFPKPLAVFTWHDGNISSTQKTRRLVERHLVQEKYSSLKGPVLFRSLIFEFMRFSWIGLRIMRRLIDRFSQLK